jgi:Tol biopolymer transport system component
MYDLPKTGRTASFWRLPCVVFAMLSLSGCFDSPSGDRIRSGSYRLVSIGGRSLPVTPPVGFRNSPADQLLEGELRIDADLKVFRVARVDRIERGATDSVPLAIAYIQRGQARRDERGLVMTMEGAPTGSYLGPDTLIFDGTRVRYRQLLTTGAMEEFVYEFDSAIPARRDLPAGVLAVTVADGLALVNTDGSAFRRVLEAARDPRWFSNGNELTVTRPDGLPHVFVVTPAGASRSVLSRTVEHVVESETGAVPTKDGMWVYFTGCERDGGCAVWRSRPDGTSAERKGPPPPSRSAGIDRVYDVSPDGRYVLFSDSRSGWNRIAILDVQTSMVRNFSMPGFAARWSPSGSHFAYLTYSGQAIVVRADGTEMRIVSGPDFHGWNEALEESGLTWSPDGQFLVAFGIDGLHAIDVAARTGTNLSFSRSYSNPAWRPTR